MTEVDVPPRVEMQSPPEYPEVARSLKLEDVVVVSVLVSETGSVSDARVLRHSSKWRGFDDAAVAAVRRWRFAPASDGGRHVACWYNVGVSFRLPR
jgi:protein TonB